MPDEETTTEETVDLEGLVGGILDERGFTKDKAARLDLLDGLEDRLTAAFKSSGGTGNPAAPQPVAQFDEAGFLGKVEALIDGKLSGVVTGGGSTKESKGGGWLSKWLGYGNS